MKEQSEEQKYICAEIAKIRMAPGGIMNLSAKIDRKRITRDRALTGFDLTREEMDSLYDSGLVKKFSGTLDIAVEKTEKKEEQREEKLSPFVEEQKSGIEMVPVADLRPHPTNAKIYGDGCDDELLESIREFGILTPLLVSSKKFVVSGNRRLNAAQMLGMIFLPCMFLADEDELAIDEILIEANRQRKKTAEQMAREYEALKTIEAERAKTRKGKASSKEGSARSIAAEKLGVSHDTAEKASRVVHKIDEMEADGRDEEAQELRSMLNEKSVNAAHQKITSKEKKPIIYEQLIECENCEKLERELDAITIERARLENELMNARKIIERREEKICELETIIHDAGLNDLDGDDYDEIEIGGKVLRAKKED